jgi:hypothetical protein
MSLRFYYWTKFPPLGLLGGLVTKMVHGVAGLHFQQVCGKQAYTVANGDFGHSPGFSICIRRSRGKRTYQCPKNDPAHPLKIGASFYPPESLSRRLRPYCSRVTVSRIRKDDGLNGQTLMCLERRLVGQNGYRNTHRITESR